METLFTTSPPQRGLVLSALAILAAAFLLSHPFTGIRHDGILYVGDALARLRPGEFHDDLYFHYGSQGRFTLLPALYATLIEWFGYGGGTMVGLLTAFALYLAATLYLVVWIAPPSLRALCVLSVTLGWTIYAGNRIFAYSESFLTARSFAEPLVLLSLGLLVRERLVAAAALLAVALFVHPLIALCGVPVLWVYCVRRDRRWLFAAPVAVVALAIAGFIDHGGPFSDLYARYDAEWLALVQEANVHAFVMLWNWTDYGIVFFDAVCLWFVWRVSDRPALRVFVATIGVVGIGAWLASLLLVDVALNPFFGKLQIWRALWVMQWLAMATLPLVLVALWRRDAHGKATASLLAIGWMAPFSVAPLPIALIAILFEVFRRRFVLSRGIVRLLGGAAVVAALVLAAQFEIRTIGIGISLHTPARLVIGQALSMNVVLLALAALFLDRQVRLAKAAPFVAIVVLAVAAVLWDQRAPWTRDLEAQPLDKHIWAGLVEPDAKIYWYREMIAPWILLGHSNYYTQQQASGAVFSREMIVEADRRRRVTALLEMQEQICRMMNGLNAKADSCEPDAEVVHTICVDGALDYVVLQSTLEGVTPTAQYATGVVENGYEKKFFLYRCSALKQG